MPLIECADCGAQVSDAAPACPKCGRPAQSTRDNEAPAPGANASKKRSTGLSVVIVFLVLAGILYIFRGPVLRILDGLEPTGPSQAEIAQSQRQMEQAAKQAENEAAVREALDYVTKLSNYQWMRVDDDNVYIGLDPPTDWATIVKAASSHCSRALDGDACMVWAKVGSEQPIGPMDSIPSYGGATGRGGRVDDYWQAK